MNITFAKRALPTSGALAVLSFEDKLSPSAAEVDAALGGRLARAVKAGRFAGGPGEILNLLAPEGLSLGRVLLVGAGKAASFTPAVAERVAAAAVKHLLKSGEKVLSFMLDPVEGQSLDALAAHMGFAARLEAGAFDIYKTKLKPKDLASLERVTLLSEDFAKAKKAYGDLSALADGVLLARGLVMEPANVLFPAEFAKRCKALESLGVEVEVLGEKDMKKLGMNALLGVGQGSERESQLVVMHWKGTTKAKKPVVLVGKGVCFDTGGISIKPAGGMEDMKGDMGGAAAVTGAIHALAARKAKTWAIGLIGLVENMPDGKAQRPGDIVKSMSGQTIEIINTDAEGRLVLADVLWYAQDRFKPEMMVDLATLTGAIQAALGGEYAGLFSNNDELSQRILKAGESEGEPLWRMPMGEAYDKMINSKFADMKNTGSRFGGSITAAQFLKRFVNDVPWAHLDIAGVAWMDEAKPTKPVWASGYGVRLLNRLVADNYEG